MNGLIWAYHWLQVGLYEPLIVGRDPAERKAGVDAALARFWSMVEDPPNAFPKVMPMTATVAPHFTKAHPRAAAIFDNLHMMHDIISDILAADTVPEANKREVIYAALDEFQDTTRNVMTEDEWLNMGHMMGGIAAMGGAASGVIPEAPSRNVPADAMAGMRKQGMQHGVPAPDDSARAALAPAQDTSAMAGMQHGAGQGAPPDSSRGETAGGTDHRAMKHAMPDSAAGPTQDHTRGMMDLHMRMMADPVIHKRMMADSAMRRMMEDMMQSMPVEHREQMTQMMREAPRSGHRMAPAKPAPKQPGAKKAADRKPADKKPAATQDSMPGMDHGKMPGMQPTDS
ncbi:MAG: hypothetical protein ACREN5_07200 [Gemmatimonadales bacterium]